MLNSNLTKQASLAHFSAICQETSKGSLFYWPTLYAQRDNVTAVPSAVHWCFVTSHQAFNAVLYRSLWTL